MPFIIARVNVPVSKEQETEIKTLMGRAIGLVPGKNESYLMLGIEDEFRFWLRGDGLQKADYIEASIFGNEDHAGFDVFAAETTEIFCQVLGISPENIHIKFDDIRAWSVGGAFIDRNRYR